MAEVFIPLAIPEKETGAPAVAAVEAEEAEEALELVPELDKDEFTAIVYSTQKTCLPK